MALFGRDSILTAYQALPFQPQLAATALTALAELQATDDDAFRDAEPGKILHELRRGELATVGEVPHSPYYGSHDATPLFLILLEEYERWTGDEELVRRLEPAARAALAWLEGPGDADADRLRDRFNRDFWHDERGHYVLALDGAKRKVDSLTSNIGHLLWSGIVDAERAALVVERLMGPEMWSGWGVRTMATCDAGYNPIEYHNGTVWPHDTAIIAEGMRRYGFQAEAATLALALIEAAEAFGFRLPEVFAGFDRHEAPRPVQYPTASCPQAWASGAVLLALRTLLGLDVVGGTLRSSPHLPGPIGRLALRGVLVRGERVEVGSR